jgi:hypothetical protein
MVEGLGAAEVARRTGKSLHAVYNRRYVLKVDEKQG